MEAATIVLMISTLTKCEAEIKSVNVPSMQVCEQIGKELGLNEYDHTKLISDQAQPYYRCYETSAKDYEEVK